MNEREACRPSIRRPLLRPPRQRAENFWRRSLEAAPQPDEQAPGQRPQRGWYASVVKNSLCRDMIRGTKEEQAGRTA